MADSTPSTVWLPKLGQGEFNGQSSFDIADASGNLLTDSSSNNVIDGTTIFTGITADVWTQNNGS